MIQHSGKNTFSKLKEKFNETEIRQLYSVLVWLINNYKDYGSIIVDVSLNEETGELVSFIIPDCDFNTWKEIAKRTKEEMRKAGLNKLASIVAIICIRGLVEGE